MGATSSADSSKPGSIPTNFALNFLPIAGAVLFGLEYTFPFSAMSLQDDYDTICENRYFDDYETDSSCTSSDLDDCGDDSHCSVYDEWGYDSSSSYYYCSSYSTYSSYYSSCCDDYRCGGAYTFTQLSISLFVFQGVGVLLELIRFIMCMTLACTTQLSQDCCATCCPPKGQRGPCVLDSVGDSLFFRLVSMCSPTVWRQCMVYYQKRTFYSFGNPWWIVYTLLHTIPVWICAFILFFGVVDIDEVSIAFWLAIVLKLAILKTKISYRRLWTPDNAVAMAVAPTTMTTMVTTTATAMGQSQTQPVVQYQQPPQQQMVQQVTMLQMPDGQLVEAQAIQDQNGNIQYVPASQVQVQPQQVQYQVQQPQVQMQMQQPVQPQVQYQQYQQQAGPGPQLQQPLQQPLQQQQPQQMQMQPSVSGGYNDNNSNNNVQMQASAPALAEAVPVSAAPPAYANIMGGSNPQSGMGEGTSANFGGTAAADVYQ